MLLAEINTACIHEAWVMKAVSPSYPRSLPPDLPPFDVSVKARLGEDGTVKEATIYRSSGYPDADAAAIDAAKASVYTPKVVDCKPTEGVCQFHEVFSVGSPLNLPTVQPRTWYTPPPPPPYESKGSG
ncbi:MAG: TonB family protein [Candidatus Cybelea sp.]